MQPRRSGIERRRSQRVLLRVGVTLHATEAQDRPPLKLFTADVSVQGALLISSENLPVDAKFSIEHNLTRERIGCRVARAQAHAPDGFHIGVEFEHAAPDFWKISFPPSDWKPETS